MKATFLILAAAGAIAAGPVQAQSDVLKAKGCLGCHDMQAKKVGPSYKDVAAKYKGKAGAESDLVAKLKEGKGHMKVNATDEELHAAVKQILAAK
ncbi:MAG TPA: hypothetical protein VIV54_02735 [Burkholderiales bacterium]